MSIRGKVRFGWDYDTKAMRVVVADKITDDRLEFKADKLPEDIAEQVLLYGIGKVLQDRNSAVVADDKFGGLAEVWDRLVAGNWHAERKAGTPTVSPVIEAIANVKGISIPAAQKGWAALSKDQRERITENLADEIAEVKAARASDEVADLADLI